MSDDRVWQVRLPNGTVHVPVDAPPDDPRRSWIYARSTADMLADKIGGTVVEVTRRQKDAVLDKEIAFALNEPKAKTPKLRTRPFGREARRAIATAILENVGMRPHARSALDTAREAANDAEYKTAIRTLKTGLPATLWIGHDGRHGLAQTAEPVWNTADPAGEDPKTWQQIAVDEIVSILVDAA